MCGPARVAVGFGIHPFQSGVYDHSPASHEAYAEFQKVTPTLIDDFWAAGYNTVGAGKILHGQLAAAMGSSTGTPCNTSPDTCARTRTPIPPAPTLLAVALRRAAHRFGRALHLRPDRLRSERRSRRSGARREGCRLGVRTARGRCRARTVLPGLRQLHPPRAHGGCRRSTSTCTRSRRSCSPTIRPDDLADLGPYARDRIIDQNHRFERLVESGIWEKAVQAYQAAITFADDRVGLVLDQLASSRFADNTIVVVWCDHGFHLGEKLHIEKFTLWERATRVPLLLHVPGQFDHAQHLGVRRSRRSTSDRP